MSAEIDVTFRPIGVDWPDSHSEDRVYSQFKAPETDTWRILKRELGMLNAERVIIQIDLQEGQIRQDGWPKSGARQPDFPGVMLSFNSDFGPLEYHTDRFPRYLENLRAIALGLEALRRVERYGITKSGQQYTGWKALPKTAGHHEPGLIERGQVLIAEHGSVIDAIKATHPDAGGDADDFRAVQAARDAEQ